MIIVLRAMLTGAELYSAAQSFGLGMLFLQAASACDKGCRFANVE